MTKQSGFTLIELMIVVAIAGVVLTLGVPAFQTFVRNQSRTASVNEFISVLLYARSEAVARNGRVVLCRSDAPTAATPACSAAGDSDWSSGWVVFADDDQDFVLDADEEVVRVGNPLSGKDLWASTDALAYRPNGRIITDEATPDDEAVFILCDDRGVGTADVPLARVIAIPMTGRPQSGTADHLGNALGVDLGCAAP